MAFVLKKFVASGRHRLRSYERLVVTEAATALSKSDYDTIVRQLDHVCIVDAGVRDQVLIAGLTGSPPLLPYLEEREILRGRLWLQEPNRRKRSVRFSVFSVEGQLRTIEFRRQVTTTPQTAFEVTYERGPFAPQAGIGAALDRLEHGSDYEEAVQ